MKSKVLMLYFLGCLVACNNSNPKLPSPREVTVVKANPYVVPADSLGAPLVVPVDEQKLKKTWVTQALKRPTDTQIHPPGTPLTSAASPALIRPLGLAPFSPPVVVSIQDSSFLSGIPPITLVKEMANKSQNPANFRSFGKLQGLKYPAILSVIEDKSGNLWFGTIGGGVYKYDGMYCTHYTEKEGLSNNYVNRLLEDRQGNLWMATRSGVTCYDGKSFRHFKGKENLEGNDISSILQDQAGNLWFGSDRGLSKYNGKSFVHFGAKQGLGEARVSCLWEDQNGQLWIGTNGNGIIKFDGKTFAAFTDQQGLSNNYIASLLQDRDGKIWIGTYGSGVTCYDPSQARFTHFTLQEGLGKSYVFNILEDQLGQLWFSTESGVVQYDGTYFTHFMEKDGFTNKSVWCGLQDRAGNLWFCADGPDGGIARYDGRIFSFYTTTEGLSNSVILGMSEDQQGNLWLATYGGGVCRYDGNVQLPGQASFTHFTENEGLCYNLVWDVTTDQKGRLWFATDRGVSFYDGETITNLSEQDGLSNIYVRHVLADRQGKLWFGTYGGGVYQYDGKSLSNYTTESGLGSNIVRFMLGDSWGNLWFATDGAGLTRFDGKTFTHFTEQGGLISNDINTLLEDQEGNLWIGTNQGISLYDGKTFTQLTEQVGLIDNVINSFFEDKQGNLWIGTGSGLSYLSKQKFRELSTKIKANTLQEQDVFFKNYTYTEGFLGINVNKGKAMLQDRKGKIWLATSTRLTVLNPELIVPDTLAPNIQLTDIGLFNERIPWAALAQKKDSSFLLSNGIRVGNFKFKGLSRWYNLPEQLSLAHHNNYLNFHFIGIISNKPGVIKYQYRLAGMDENWSGVSTENQATYGNLPPGHYTFMVKAMNADGYWSQTQTYYFSIRPPWWLTWWAKTLYTFLAIAAILFIMWWNARRLIARAKELEIEVDRATAVIRQQKQEVETEKQKSDDLLLNILPREVAEELKAKGSTDAKLIDEVTVLFTDFKDFTKLSENHSPKDLVAEINVCFSAFDLIMEKYGIEKIKTIGDAYMAAGGLPVPNQTHATDVVKAALEVQQYMQERKQSRQAAGELVFEVRIGIHTGPVVAGIVGLKKYAYDIWGDTVNTASRMESSGEPGKVNISGSTREWVKDQFKCTHRGRVDAKGKGAIDMYFVEGWINL